MNRRARYVLSLAVLDYSGPARSVVSVFYTVTRPMANSSIADTTQLLRAWADGDSQALQQLTPRVYRELRRVAAHLLQNGVQGTACKARIWFTRCTCVW